MTTATKHKQRKPARRDSVVNLRLPTPVRDTIDSAAELTGKSRTAFIIESAQQQAIDVLLDRRLFTLSGNQYDAFVRALEAKPKPNEKLKRLFAKKSPWEA